ncbi:glycosyltransferase [Rhizobium sp. 2MFCol3.1]|uniref:glycosyltransferase n=1 Tax=Rhizobium sp. 2MFCol3.1 TaxID=1246459 RepID=UPI000378A368|nr:glycosyltransferase [Rhizobium sp. 2MFCol3.1]
MSNAALKQNEPTEQHLSVCIVTFKPDLQILARTLESLRIATDNLTQVTSSVLIIDNSSTDVLSGWLRAQFPDFAITLKAGHGNVGFGRANNMALPYCGDFHLVLNPDVELSPESLVNAVAFMENNRNCGLLTPLVFGIDGQRQYLCKRFPSLLDLALRGFAPARIRKCFGVRLDRYEMREIRDDQVYWRPPIVSGCFMFFRGDVFRAAGGFDRDYFLYFEDFDLSLRVARMTEIAFVPSVQIVHGGGNAGGKGLWHIRQFLAAAATFYWKFGLKLI